MFRAPAWVYPADTLGLPKAGVGGRGDKAGRGRHDHAFHRLVVASRIPHWGIDQPEFA